MESEAQIAARLREHYGVEVCSPCPGHGDEVEVLNSGIFLPDGLLKHGLVVGLASVVEAQPILHLGPIATAYGHRAYAVSRAQACGLHLGQRGDQGITCAQPAGHDGEHFGQITWMEP